MVRAGIMAIVLLLSVPSALARSGAVFTPRQGRGHSRRRLGGARLLRRGHDPRQHEELRGPIPHLSLRRNKIDVDRGGTGGWPDPNMDECECRRRHRHSHALVRRRRDAMDSLESNLRLALPADHQPRSLGQLHNQYYLDVIVAGRADAQVRRSAVAWGESTQSLTRGAQALSIEIPIPAADGESLRCDIRLVSLDPVGLAGRATVDVAAK